MVNQPDCHGLAVSLAVGVAQRGPAVDVRICGNVGAGKLAFGVGPGGDGVSVLIGENQHQIRHGGLVQFLLDGKNGLGVIVQQPPIGEADGNCALRAQRHGSIGNGLCRVAGIRDGHEILAHGGLALCVRGRGGIELLNYRGFQLRVADSAFLVLAALRAGGGLFVNDPVALLVSGSLHIRAFVAVAAADAGVGRVTHIDACRFRDNSLVVVSLRRL